MALSDLDLTSSGLFTDLDSLVTSLSAYSATASSDLVRFTTDTPHLLTANDRVTVFNVSNQLTTAGDPFTLTGTFRVEDVPSANTFTVNLSLSVPGTRTESSVVDFTADVSPGTTISETSASLPAGLIAENFTGAAETTGTGQFFTTEIQVDAINRSITFLSTSGTDVIDAILNNTPIDILDGNLSIAGKGVAGQALYSFFKYAYKTVPRMPQFTFPMSSITNEQFEFINTWYMLETPIYQNARTVVTNATITTNSITTTDTTVDFRKYQAGEQVRVYTDTGNDSDVMTVNATTKLSITFNETTLNAGTDNAVVDGRFEVRSADLVRTAGFTFLDNTGSYIKEYYAGVITLGSLVDIVDQPYYLQESTATASTYNTIYTGPANQPVAIRKVANSRLSDGGSDAGNLYSDMQINARAGAVFTAGTSMTIDFENASYENLSTIQSPDASEFVGLSANDIVYVNTNNAASGHYTVLSATGTAGGNTDLLILKESLSVDATATVTVSALDSIVTTKSLQITDGTFTDVGADGATTPDTVTLNNIPAVDLDLVDLQIGDLFAVRGTPASVNDRVYEISSTAAAGLSNGIYSSVTITIDNTATSLPTDGNKTNVVGQDESNVAFSMYTCDKWGVPAKVGTDMSIFSDGDLTTITNADTGGNNLTARIAAHDQLSSSAYTLAYPASTFTASESGQDMIVDSDRRTAFKIFVRERGKSYAESALSDIGVTNMSTIVYRFPITNATDINIFSIADSQLDSAATSTDAGDVPADQSLSGTNMGAIQIHYLRNPQTGLDNLNIAGAWTAGVNYNVGDVVQVSHPNANGSTQGGNTAWSGTDGKWFYLAQDTRQAVAGSLAATSLSAQSDTLTEVTSAVAGTDILFSPIGQSKSTSFGNGGANAVIVDTNATSQNFDTAGFDVGDVITVSGSATNTFDGNNFKISGFATDTSVDGTATNNVIILENESGYDTWSSPLTETAGISSTRIKHTAMWKDWSAFINQGDNVNVPFKEPLEFPSRGNYTSPDPSLQGGQRQVRDNYYPFDVIIDAVDTLNDGNTPYVDVTNTTSTTGVYEFSQWALRLNDYINESASGLPQYQRTGQIANLLVDFVGDTLVTRQGVFIDDIDIDDQNAVQFTDYEGTTNLTYPKVVQVVLNFNENLQADNDAVFYLYYTTLNGADNDFGEINAQQVVESDGSTIVGTRSGNQNKVNNNASYSFQYGYDEDTAGGTKSTGVNFNVTAVAIGLTNGVYVTSAADVTDTGAIITLVSPVERNYINP